MKLLASATTLLLVRSAGAFHASSKLLSSSASKHLAASQSTRQSQSFYSSTTTRLNMSKPFSVIVEAEINPDHMDEFLSMIENNAINSRKEPGCLRFDVLRAQDNPNKFFFYEVYENAAAVDFHKTQAHYQAWADFKEKGVISSASQKADGEFMT